MAFCGAQYVNGDRPGFHTMIRVPSGRPRDSDKVRVAPRRARHSRTPRARWLSRCVDRARRTGEDDFDAPARAGLAGAARGTTRARTDEDDARRSTRRDRGSTAIASTARDDGGERARATREGLTNGMKSCDRFDGRRCTFPQRCASAMRDGRARSRDRARRPAETRETRAETRAEARCGRTRTRGMRWVRRLTM